MRCGMADLTDFRLEVTGLAASKGFLVGGERPCSHSNLTGRPTKDLDFFTAPDRGHVGGTRCPRSRGTGARLG
jgi:hypothetical protein